MFSLKTRAGRYKPTIRDFRVSHDGTKVTALSAPRRPCRGRTLHLPMLANLETLGHSWREHGIVRSQVVNRNSPMADGSQVLWDYMKERLDQAVVEGLLEDG